jgi:hypothetical protein
LHLKDNPGFRSFGLGDGADMIDHAAIREIEK